jgi:hypothetical protein
LLVVTGLRIGEITGLDVGDVSGAASRIRVRGKGNRERTVYVTNERLLLDFQTYWEWRYRVAGAASCLFVNSLGRRLTAPAFRKRLRTVSKKLVVDPHLTPHRFRHSAATLLIEEGVDIRLVQRLLGHASIATTELYTKVSDNSLVAAIERADTLSQVDRELMCHSAGATEAAPARSSSLVSCSANKGPAASLCRLFVIVGVINAPAGVEVRLLICDTGRDAIHRHFAGEVNLVSMEGSIPVLLAVQ